MRGHGTTRAEDSDLSVSTLVEDCIAVLQVTLFLRATCFCFRRNSAPPCPINHIFFTAVAENNKPRVPSSHGTCSCTLCTPTSLQELMAGTEGPTASVVVLGHSLGGSIAARACASKKIPGLGGLFVMDVVEGTAVASLDHMDAVLAARPESFASVRDAIVWSLDRRMTRNPAVRGSHCCWHSWGILMAAVCDLVAPHKTRRRAPLLAPAMFFQRSSFLIFRQPL